MAGDLTQRRHVVVEFVGLPGVGKSYITRLVVARLAERGVAASSQALQINHELEPWRRVLHKVALCAGEFLRDPAGAARAVRTLARSDQESRVDVARLSYNWLFLSGLIRRARGRGGVEILDEGMIQLVWSIAFAGGEGAVRDCAAVLLADPARAVALPDVVVLVDAPLDRVGERLAERGTRASRVDRMGPAERRQALVRGAALLDEIVSDDTRLVDGSRMLLRRVRNGDPREVAADVVPLVEELVSLGKPRSAVSPVPRVAEQAPAQPRSAPAAAAVARSSSRR